MRMYCGNLLRVGGDNNSIRFISCVTVCDVMGLWGLGETVYSSKFVREEQGRAPGSHLTRTQRQLKLTPTSLNDNFIGVQIAR